MVIYFTEEDLVSFGEYMVSPQRRQHFESHPEPTDLSLEERLSGVHDSDLANWAYIVSMNKQINDEVTNPSTIN
jgi:hypothetical protein